jgi:orotate phosphoribosyltransferase
VSLITKDRLAAEIYALCRISGDFLLRSGRDTHTYFDKYRFEARPAILAAVVKEMVSFIPKGTQVLAGLELGGIPVVTMLSHYSGLPAAFVRKVAKPYGTARLCEGAEVSGKRVLLVEDVVTAGGQIRLSAADLRGIGALVTHALCVIDRAEGGRANLERDGIVLLSLFDANQLPTD